MKYSRTENKIKNKTKKKTKNEEIEKITIDHLHKEATERSEEKQQINEKANEHTKNTKT